MNITLIPPLGSAPVGHRHPDLAEAAQLHPGLLSDAVRLGRAARCAAPRRL